MSFRSWLACQATWANTVRASGLTGLAFLVVFRQHPDSSLVVAMVSLMGLPSFISLDGGAVMRNQTQSRQIEPKDEEEK